MNKLLTTIIFNKFYFAFYDFTVNYFAKNSDKKPLFVTIVAHPEFIVDNPEFIIDYSTKLSRY